jgi:hypothetical protein
VLLNLVSFGAGHALMARHLSGFAPSDATVYPPTWFDYHAQTLDKIPSPDEGPFPFRDPRKLSLALRVAALASVHWSEVTTLSPARGGYLQSLAARLGHGRGPPSYSRHA